MFGNKPFGNKPCTNFSLSIESKMIERVNSTKFLGVILDSKLSWGEHIVHVTSNIARGIGVLNRARYLLPRKLLLALYYTLVYPYLTYCNVVWGVAGVTSLSKLTSLQKRAVRIVSGSNYLAHIKPLFVKHNILKLHNIHIFLISQFMYRYKYLLLPNSCMHLVTVAPPNPTHITRTSC